MQVAPNEISRPACILFLPILPPCAAITTAKFRSTHLSPTDELDRFRGSCVMKESSLVKNGVWNGSPSKEGDNNNAAVREMYRLSRRKTAAF